MTDKITIERELELIDGMIEVQLHHAAQCDGIANRTMADKQKGWDMERVALLRKMRAALAAQPADAQPTGKAPCARHCEAPAFEGEIRRLKREATIKDSLTIRPPAPAAVPLTDEQIDDICWNFNCSNTPLVEYDRLIARAIEAAHGIAAAGDKP